MLPILVLLLPFVAATTPCYECDCSGFSDSQGEVVCGPVSAKLRSSRLEVQCSTPDKLDDKNFEFLKLFGAASSVKFNGCPLPRLSGLINTSVVEQLTAENALQAFNLTEGHLDGFSRLRYLQLSANKITALPEGIFSPLSVLENLTLRSNKLRTLPTLPKSLVVLELGENFLSEAPKDLPKLKQLGLWKNRFSTVGHLSGLPALESLDLNSNGLHSLADDAFSALPELRDLNLRKSRFRALPPNIFASNKHLYRFRMTENDGVVQLPQSLLADLSELKVVNLDGTGLVLIPQDIFRNTTALEDLTMSKCKLEALPPGIFDNCCVKMLDLSDNNLKSVPIFSRTVPLQELKLENNQIETLNETDLRYLESLEKLNLSNNKLKFVDTNAFQTNSALRHVYMDNNAISFSDSSRDYFGSYSPFHFCTVLETLSLRNNLISDIFADWRLSLIHLQKLDLRQNHISVITSEDLQFISTKLEVDLRQNNVTVIDLRSLHVLVVSNTDVVKSAGRNVTVNVDGESIDCDNCLTYSLLNYLSRELNPDFYKFVDLRVEESNSCLANLSAESIVCPKPSQYCPQNCSCGVRPANRAEILKCSSLPPNTTQYKQKTEIILEKNIGGNISLAANNISSLQLSGSQIEHLFNIPSNLTVLKLNNNKLRSLSGELLKKMSTVQNMTLSSNPWACDCDTLELLAFMQQNYRAISDFANVTCEDGRLLSKLIADDLCNNMQIAVAASLAVAVGGIVLGVLAALYFKFQHQIKVWLYAHNMLLWLVTENEVDKNKKYDAFVSYSHKDEAFVAHKLMPGLEPQFKLCIHARDWNAGDWIPDQIARSVEESRRTLVVLSPSFLESVWGRMEFRAAHQQALGEGRARVVVILLQDIGPLDKLDPDLRAYLSMNTYLKWDDPWFWDKLHYAMPHRKIKGAESKNQRSLAIKINDKLEQMQNSV